MKTETRKYHGKDVFLTTEWTNRRFTIMSENCPRSAVIHRGLAAEMWSIDFAREGQTDITIRLDSICDDHQQLITAGIKYVVDGECPNSDDFDKLEKIRRVEANLVGSLITKLLRRGKKKAVQS